MKNTRVFIGILSHNTLPTSYLLIIFISTSYEDQGTKPGGNKPIWRRTYTLYTIAGLWLLSFVNTDCIQHKNVINRLRTVCVILVILEKNCTEWQLVVFISIFNRARSYLSYLSYLRNQKKTRDVTALYMSKLLFIFFDTCIKYTFMR